MTRLGRGVTVRDGGVELEMNGEEGRVCMEECSVLGQREREATVVQCIVHVEQHKAGIM